MFYKRQRLIHKWGLEQAIWFFDHAVVLCNMSRQKDLGGGGVTIRKILDE